MRPSDTTWLNFGLGGLAAAGLVLTGCQLDDLDVGKGSTGGGAATTSTGFGSGSTTGSTTGSGTGSGSTSGTSGGLNDDAGVDGADGGLIACCAASPFCNLDEETYDTLEACEAAGDGCRENTVCCSTVFCRPSACTGDLVPEAPSCQANGYCYALPPSDQFCTGERGSCPAGSRPITADAPCPARHKCADEPDGQRCAKRVYASREACLEEGDYTSTPTSAEGPTRCDAGDSTLGQVGKGAEAPACCVDSDGDHGPAGCEAMDATGVGLCEAFFGYAWDGETCVGISGCSCEGTDCDALYQDPFACQDARIELGCLPPDCRTTGCDEGEHCDICWSGYACLPEGAVC